MAKEGKPHLQRVVGISGATVPSSGSFLSTVSRPFLWNLLRKTCEGRKGGFGELRGFKAKLASWHPTKARVEGTGNSVLGPGLPTKEPLAARWRTDQGRERAGGLGWQEQKLETHLETSVTTGGREGSS